MNQLKKLTAVLLAVVIFTVIVLPFSTIAADSGYKIEVTNLTAVPGDTVIVSAEIKENAGFMAMTFSLCYDKDAFTFKDYHIGVFRHDYLIVDHPESGYVSIVDCESKNRKYIGVLASIEFTVKEKATPGKHDFSIKNIYPLKYGDSLSGCFAVSNDVSDSSKKSVYSVIPEVSQGSVTVGETCSNAGHTFSDYKQTVSPTCEDTGIKSRTCTRCGHIENAEIPATGHSFEDKWTIDKAATDTQAGIMSRHCKNCSAVTDEISFTKEIAEKEHFDNKIDTTVTEKDSDFVKEKAEEFKEKEKENENSQPSTEGKKENALGDVFSSISESKSDSFGIILIAAAVIIAGIAAVLIIILNKKARK